MREDYSSLKTKNKFNNEIDIFFQSLMENFLKNKRFFCILLLICLAGFFILPDISLANDFDSIDLEEMGKYLELPAKDVQSLLFTLNQVFTTDWIYRESSGFSTAEECLVPLVLRKVIRIQALNHLLIDAPIQTTWAIIKNAIKIARVFLTKDISGVLDELEKESVKKAVAYGMSVLFENEIRVTPGAIEYEYISQRGTKQEVVIQYILIYQPLDVKKGEVLIRFYSPQPIDPPKSEGAWGMTGTPHSVEGKLPPFIVDVRGTVENYKWVESPSIEIDFPAEVPDLGIRPLSWWEKYVLKPIESTIKDVEIIITKVTGKSLGLVDAWNKIKSFVSGITDFFSPAAIVSPSTPTVSEYDSAPTQTLGPEPGPTLEPEPIPEPTPPPVTPTPTPEPKISLEDLKKMLDDIARQIDALTQKLNELIEAESQQQEEIVYGRGGIRQVQPKIEQDDEEEIEEATEDQDQEETPLPTPLLTVVINEIAWMGTKASDWDEWIELYNNTTSSIDLIGWQIKKDNEDFITISTSTTGTTIISDFYLLERAEKATDINADFVYGGQRITNDPCEILSLYNQLGQLIDRTACRDDGKWFAGDNNTKQTMERIDSSMPGTNFENWANNNLITRNGLDADENKINGTPRAENSISKSQTEITQQNLDELFEEFDKIILTYYGNPYITSGLKIPENKILSIEPGVILKFRESGMVYETGSLIIEGTLLATSSQEKIVFTSIYDENYGGQGLGNNPWEKKWRGLRFYPSSQGSELENVLVRYAGYSFGHEYSRGVVIEDASIKLKNSIIEKSATGLYLKDSNSEIETLTIQDSGSYSSIQISAGKPIIKNSIFKNNLSGIIVENGSRAEIIGNYFEGIEYGEGVISVRNSYPFLRENDGQNNTLNSICLFGSAAEDWTLYANNNLFYFIKDFQIASSSNMTIEPGVIIKFERYGKLEAEGKLFVNGSSNDKVIFTSITDDATTSSPFYWNRLHLSPSSEGSRIKNAEIKYGGVTGDWSYSRGALWVQAHDIILENLYFESNPGYDIYISAEYSPEIINVTAEKIYKES